MKIKSANETMPYSVAYDHDWLRRRLRGAFTLVEILMAMAIFGLVLTAIYATWTVILRGSRVGLEAAAQVQRERAAMQMIEEALLCSRSYLADVQHYSFIGQNGSEATMSFVAELPASFPVRERYRGWNVRRVAFTLREGNDGQKELVLRQAPMLMEFDEDEEKYPFVLAKNVKELTFGFWDTRVGDWVDEWTQTNSLPKMVKITLRMTPPASTVAPRYSSLPVEEVVRVVGLPSTGVPANLQRGAAPPGGRQP